MFGICMKTIHINGLLKIYFYLFCRSRSVSFSTCYRKSFGYDNTKVRTPSAYSLRNHNHMAAAPLRQNSAPSSRRHVKFSGIR